MSLYVAFDSAYALTLQGTLGMPMLPEEMWRCVCYICEDPEFAHLLSLKRSIYYGCSGKDVVKERKSAKAKRIMYRVMLEFCIAFRDVPIPEEILDCSFEEEPNDNNYREMYKVIGGVISYRCRRNLLPYRLRATWCHCRLTADMESVMSKACVMFREFCLDGGLPMLRRIAVRLKRRAHADVSVRGLLSFSQLSGFDVSVPFQPTMHLPPRIWRSAELVPFEPTVRTVVKLE